MRLRELDNCAELRPPSAELRQPSAEPEEREPLRAGNEEVSGTRVCAQPETLQDPSLRTIRETRETELEDVSESQPVLDAFYRQLIE